MSAVAKLPKGIIVRLAAVPFDIFDSREGLAAATTVNMVEELGGYGAKWMARETSGLNAITVTVDRTRVYTVGAGGSLESEIAPYEQIVIAVGVAGVVNLYVEGWTRELMAVFQK